MYLGSRAASRRCTMFSFLRLFFHAQSPCSRWSEHISDPSPAGGRGDACSKTPLGRLPYRGRIRGLISALP
ncbi:hypothetical protein EXIGLDRAFT_52236 [Exidia glandulosa HHB12029]|uniref:Uncharacterized protein n=1 Tax=Exidia glandulosa HHB12029 TaxID=1314781 RepID=A0A165ICC5_EXIGL|nr:hypothetical protein EXIGLDRAFT_52236 [Exidia glandulosa HHB12029]